MSLNKGNIRGKMLKGAKKKVFSASYIKKDVIIQKIGGGFASARQLPLSAQDKGAASAAGSIEKITEIAHEQTVACHLHIVINVGVASGTNPCGVAWVARAAG